MKSKVVVFILAVSMALSTGVVSAFAEEPVPSSQEQTNKEEPAVLEGEYADYNIAYKEGDTFVVNFLLNGNQGINNSTFRVKYDPNVIMAVENTDEDDLERRITYGNEKIQKPLYTNSFVNGQLKLVPKEGLYDFEGKSDGVKTSAELGIIKLAQIAMYSSIITEAKEDGIFLSMKFKMVNPGKTTIEIVPSLGANGPAQNMFYGLKNVARNIEVKPINVNISTDLQVPTPTEGNTEN